jgi:hypothetical protein
MIVVLLAGSLVALSVLAVLRPFTSGRVRPLTATDADHELRARLLRQLRDLDDDLACGKLTHEDHRRLRAPLEARTADVLHRIADRHAPHDLSRPAPPQTASAGPPGRHHRSTRVLALTTAAGALAALGFLLNAALVPRGSGATITGDAPAGAAGAPSPPTRSGPALGTPQPPASSRATAQQVAAVNAAVKRVRDNPRDAAAHLDLARAYTDAASPQLATIEYLAVTRIDPANGEANTALALVAFAAGQARQAEDLVDTALAAHPRYPEALYARGLIRLMGLQQPAAAHRDLTAYLAAAPFGAHRATVQTLLAMIPPKDSR